MIMMIMSNYRNILLNNQMKKKKMKSISLHKEFDRKHKYSQELKIYGEKLQINIEKTVRISTEL